MRVNMDSSIIGDPSFKLVAVSLGVDWKQVIGSCFLLWNACYERRSERLRIVEANVAAELPGFAEALIAEDLATDVGDGTVIIHGVSKRIEFLNKQAERGAKGGKRKANSKPSKRLANATANAKPESAECLSGRSASAVANTPPPALALDLAPPPAPDRGGGPEPEGLPTPEQLEQRCRSRARVAYDHLVKQVGELQMDGTPDTPRLAPNPHPDYLDDCGLLDAARKYDAVQLHHAIDVRIAEARAKRTGRYLNPPTLFKGSAFAFALGMTVESASRPPTAKPEPPRPPRKKLA